MADWTLPITRREPFQAAADSLRRRQRRQDLAVRLTAAAVILALWEIGGRQVSPYLFAPPSAIIGAAGQVIGSGGLWQDFPGRPQSFPSRPTPRTPPRGPARPPVGPPPPP